MTDHEYKEKFEAISVSDASPEIKEAALDRLNDQYYGAPRRAIAIMQESAPEPIKGGLD